MNNSHQINNFISLKNTIKYPYNSGEKIKKAEQVEIVNICLNLQLKNSFDKEGMRDPIKITRVDNGRCKPYIKVPKGGNRCHWAKQNGYTHIEAYWL